MKTGQIATVIFGLILLITIGIAAWDLSPAVKVGLFAGYLVGIHVVYGFLFNRDITISYVTAPADGNPKLRFFLFAFAVLMIIWVLWYAITTDP